MTVHAGQILHIGGLSLIDRVQSAGLGAVRVPVDTVREVGNENVVDKVPQEPDFTFTLESYDMSHELEALVMGVSGGKGEVGTGPGPTQRPGAGDPDGTAYVWSNSGFLNIPSPWKDGLNTSGNIIAGHLIPGFFPTRLRYRFGVTENAMQTVELHGGSFYYAGTNVLGAGQPACPVEDYRTGDGATVAFATSAAAIPYRIGGAGGTSFKSVFGVIVDGVLQTEGVDYNSTPNNSASPGIATVTFVAAPKTGAQIRYAYFTTAAQSYPIADLASTTIKPAAVRGRHICVYLGSGGSRVRIGGIQTFELDATINVQLERELCNQDIIGVSVLGFDATGNFVTRSKDPSAFIALLSKATGVAATEVIGWLNTNSIALTVQILNPANPAAVLKTIYVPDAMIQPPGTETRVNQPVDYTFAWEAKQGDFQVIKGSFLP